MAAAEVSSAPFWRIVSVPLPSIPSTACVRAGKLLRENASDFALNVTTTRPDCAVASATPAVRGRRNVALACPSVPVTADAGVTTDPGEPLNVTVWPGRGLPLESCTATTSG